jgi:hypothetical protein
LNNQELSTMSPVMFVVVAAALMVLVWLLFRLSSH